MNSQSYDTPISIGSVVVTQDPEYGSAISTWTSITGNLPIWCEWMDTPPSRSEGVRQGLQVAINQTRVRLHYRADINSSMQVTNLETGVLYNIVGGPAMLGRHEQIELVLEKYSS
jgi:head-tail adaptor